MSTRQPISSMEDWMRFIANPQNNTVDLLAMRRLCYSEIEALRGRPLIVYATKFVDVSIPNVPNYIDLTDIDGFADLVKSIPIEKKSVDVLLHSPGGRPDATERIVDILRERFDEVHFLIPHSAYSAATMLALSGNSIELHPIATLGPIDPQLNGIPARSIIKGFEKVRDQLTESPEKLPAYLPLIEKYTLELLEICNDSEALSKMLVSDWINKYMLKGTEKYSNQIKESVEFFSNYETHLLHSRPLTLNKLKDFQLNIQHSNPALSELLREAYILINGFFSLTQFVKLYENNLGVSWGKQYVTTTPLPQQ